jgi:hypothetical protein
LGELLDDLGESKTLNWCPGEDLNLHALASTST